MRNRVVVAGASGELGRSVCRMLRRAIPGAELVAGDHLPDRVDRTVDRVGADAGVRLDVRSEDSLRAGLDGCGLVVVAAPQREPFVQRVALDAGVHSVDVGALREPAVGIVRLDGDARRSGVAAVAMAGLFPGLSGLLAADLAGGGPDVELVEVALRQSVNGRAGHAGVVDMLRLIAAPAPPGRSRAPGPGGLREVDHPEREVLAPLLGDGVRMVTRTGWDDRGRNAVVGALARAGVLSRLAPLLARTVRHDPGRPEAVRLTVRARSGSHDERHAIVEAVSDYDATAAVAAALGALALDGLLVGAGHPAALTTARALCARLPGDVLRVELPLN